MSDEDSGASARSKRGRASRPPLDVGAVARDDALLDAIGTRRALQPTALGADAGPEIDNQVVGDPVVAMLQAYVADLDENLVAAHPSLADDDRALSLEFLASHGESAQTSLQPAKTTPMPLGVAARADATGDESAVLSGPAARIQAAARILTAARGTRIVRELPATAHRRPLGRHTAISSAAAMAVAFTLSVGGVAAAVTGDPMTPYRQVLQTVGITQASADVSPQEGVAIARDLGAAQAAVDRGDTVSARKFIAAAEKSLDEHLEEGDVDDGSLAASLQHDLAALNQETDTVEAAASEDPTLAEGPSGAGRDPSERGGESDGSDPVGESASPGATDATVSPTDPTDPASSAGADSPSPGPTDGQSPTPGESGSQGPTDASSPSTSTSPSTSPSASGPDEDDTDGSASPSPSPSPSSSPSPSPSASVTTDSTPSASASGSPTASASGSPSASASGSPSASAAGSPSASASPSASGPESASASASPSASAADSATPQTPDPTTPPG